jgi:hypothetical protein
LSPVEEITDSEQCVPVTLQWRLACYTEDDIKTGEGENVQPAVHISEAEVSMWL